MLPQITAVAFGLFGILALLLASVRITGVMAYTVGRRTHEFGIRLALGAESRDIRRHVLRDGLFLTAVGIVIGLAGVVATSHLLSFVLFDISPTDPLTCTSVPLLLAAVALAACTVPARRASKTEPRAALRYE
jgi:ABC-type antimicrobial peptide transport system permease subunit